jgi:hypothetical protein
MDEWRSVKRAVFARHSNPWSAWTRWASTPLLLVPVWRRSWRDGALVGVWMALNPVVFGKPAHERAWATRAVLGEERWIAERPMDTAMAVDVAATAAGLVAMVAAGRRRAMPAAAATAVEMGLLMAYWELMARYYDRNIGVRRRSAS